MNLSTYNHSFGIKNKILRVLWGVGYFFLFRPFISGLFRRWRIFVLQMFGAKLSGTVNIYSSVKIWAPWNLAMGDYSCLGPYVDCYNQGKISIGANTVISQKTYLCASTHDFTKSDFPLVCKPIVIGSQVWVAADAFVGPGLTIGEGAVVAAKAVVVKDVEPWTVVGGNPARFIKKREIKN